MIYTSYFGNLRNIDLDKYKVFTICNEKPEFITDPRIGELGYIFGPQEPLLTDYKSGLVDQEHYTNIYLSWLNANKNQISDILVYLVIGQHKPCVFLCFEKPEDFCHRHLLAKWLTETFGIETKEL